MERAAQLSKDLDIDLDQVASTFESLKVFPNPFNDVINIRYYDKEVNYKTVRIFDNAGRTMFAKDISDRLELEIDASNFHLGVYFVEIVDDHGNKFVEKFVKVN